MKLTTFFKMKGNIKLLRREHGVSELNYKTW